MEVTGFSVGRSDRDRTKSIFDGYERWRFGFDTALSAQGAALDTWLASVHTEMVRASCQLSGDCDKNGSYTVRAVRRRIPVDGTATS